MITVAQARPSQRAEFIRQTYMHLAGAVLAFIVLETILIQSPIGPAFATFVLTSRFAWLGILGGFSLLGWLARSLAANARSRDRQYLGLGIYVVLEAIIFVPIIFLAINYAGPEVLPTAAILTGLMFAGLSAVALITRKDFSFLGSILTIGGFVALGLIVCSAIFGFSLGLFFSVAMVAFASGAILYTTSNIIHYYSTDGYVGAALELFAAVAVLFYYVLRILLSLSSRR